MSKQIVQVELYKVYPSPTNPRKYFNADKLKQLAASIIKVGLIQDVTLREKPAGSDKYEIVCGERRWRACKIAGTITISANIRELSDEEVQELQFIENLEREDVHPMDEAVTFAAMQHNKTRTWLLADIAAKINKPESYIVQRLQLNNLIPALQKEFWDEKFLIGHAILFSRLTEADQKECAKNATKGGYFGTVKDTQDYIERNIMRQLSSAPFKMDDGSLVVKCGAGACTHCFKRSGGNTLLFSDIKQADRCFDKKCFYEKKEAWLIREVAEILENKPEILLVDYGYHDAKVPVEITKLSKEYKVRILKYSVNEIQTYQSNGYSSFKALWVSGDDMGLYKHVYRKMEGKAAVAAKIAAGEKLTPDDITSQISGINERQTRALEIDAEKVWKEVSNNIKNPAYFEKKIDFNCTSTFQEETNAIAFALLCAVKYDYREAACKVLNFKDSHYGLSSAKGLKDVSREQLFNLLRLFTISNLKDGGSHKESAGPYMLMPLLKFYDSKTIATIETAQNDIAKLRIERSGKRVEILEEQKKLLKPKKDKKPEVKIITKLSEPSFT